MGTAANLDLGPCSVAFGTDASEVDLGYTEGGVTITFGTQTVELKSDQTGETPLDEVIVGQTAVIKVPLAEVTFDNLAIALNQTKLQYNGAYGVPGTNLVGTSLLSAAQSLVLTKFVDGVESTDSEDIIKFAVCAATGNFDYVFNKSNQRIVMVEFKAYPDANGNLYMIGDEDACESGS